VKNSFNDPRKNDGKDMMKTEGTEGEQVTENEGSETTESTNSTETIENEETDQDSPMVDHTEQVIIEQDFEFKPEVWYRVVIDFEL
jgi:hypothetical protein